MHCACRTFLARATQLLPSQRFSDREKRAQLTLGAHAEHSMAFAVSPGTLEVTLAQARSRNIVGLICTQVLALTRVAAARPAGAVPQAEAHDAWRPCQSWVTRSPPTQPLSHLCKWLLLLIKNRILGAACAQDAGPGPHQYAFAEVGCGKATRHHVL